MATATAIEPSHHGDPYSDDDDEMESVASFDSDSSSLRALKTKIQEYNSILRGLNLLPTPPSLHDDVDSEDEDFQTLDDTSKLREELFAIDQQGTQFISRRHPQMQIQLQQRYQEQEPLSDDCWSFFQKWIPWRPRAWCDPFEDELHYLFVGMDGHSRSFR
jgi:hypothetical protein